MRYRMLGKTGLKVSEIGLGGEWLERHNAEEVKAVVDRCAALGINILDCWMSNQRCAPKSATPSRATGRSGLSRATLALPGRTASMFATRSCPP